ncbi:MAG: hypothetical protein HDQ88_11805 [Clostridia bacterium]|nr:hypothetical protein [Clostridia bacterium]
MDKKERRWLVAGCVFLLLIIFLCASSPYWDTWSQDTGTASQCNCPWCQAEREGINLDEYGLDYYYDQDGLNIIMSPYCMLGEGEPAGEPIEEPVHNPDGYYVMYENGHDIVLYSDGDGNYYYCESEDGYPVITDEPYEGWVPGEEPIDDTYGGVAGEMPVVGEDGQTFYIQFGD